MQDMMPAPTPDSIVRDKIGLRLACQECCGHCANFNPGSPHLKVVANCAAYGIEVMILQVCKDFTWRQ